MLVGTPSIVTFAVAWDFMSYFYGVFFSIILDSCSFSVNTMIFFSMLMMKRVIAFYPCLRKLKSESTPNTPATPLPVQPVGDE